MRPRARGSLPPVDSYPSEAEARAAIVETCRRMHARRYLVASDGNVSLRLGPERLLVTPSGARKGFMQPEQLLITDMEGRALPGQAGRPSSELPMHLAIYRARPELGAVVHAHPPLAIAHTLAEAPLGALLPEAFCMLGEVAVIPYTTPGTDALPQAIAEPARRHVAMILARHGTVTVGRDLDEAYDRLEVLEHTATISWLARGLADGPLEGLSEAERAALIARHGSPTA